MVANQETNAPPEGQQPLSSNNNEELRLTDLLFIEKLEICINM